MSVATPDYIVVGAGSAGCTLAARLSRLTGRSTVLIETPSAEAATHDRVRPAHWLRLMGSSDDWNFQTQPSSHLAGRSLNWPRGRGMGGSSRINAMIWFPPTPADWNAIQVASGHAWSIDDLQKAFAEVEAIVSPEPPRWISDTAEWFMRFASDHRATADQPMLYWRTNRRGQRWTTNEILTDGDDNRFSVIRAHVDRIEFDQQRACGVHVVSAAGQPQTLACRRGVILCAGTIGTPSILMRSGIGPTDVLRENDIAVRVEHNQVGANLADHLLMPLIFETRGKNFSSEQSSASNLARWQIAGTGKLASNIAECGGLFREQTVQVHVTPTHYLTYPAPSATAMMTLGINLTQPKSRGRLQIASPRHDDPPLIHDSYLSHPDDRQGLIDAVKWARNWIYTADSNADSRAWIAREQVPGSKRTSDEAILKSISRYAQTLYHPVGTCRLSHQTDSPVDSKFRVRKCAGLWCADASVLPTLTVGNPSAMVMTLASLAAQTIGEQD